MKEDIRCSGLYDASPEHAMVAKCEKRAYTDLPRASRCVLLADHFGKAFDVDVPRAFVTTAVDGVWTAELWRFDADEFRCFDMLQSVDLHLSGDSGTSTAACLTVTNAPLPPGGAPEPALVLASARCSRPMVPVGLEGVPLIALPRATLTLTVESATAPGPATVRYRVLPLAQRQSEGARDHVVRTFRFAECGHYLEAAPLHVYGGSVHRAASSMRKSSCCCAVM